MGRMGLIKWGQVNKPAKTKKVRTPHVPTKRNKSQMSPSLKTTTPKRERAKGSGKYHERKRRKCPGEKEKSRNMQSKREEKGRKKETAPKFDRRECELSLWSVILLIWLNRSSINQSYVGAWVSFSFYGFPPWIFLLFSPGIIQTAVSLLHSPAYNYMGKQQQQPIAAQHAARNPTETAVMTASELPRLAGCDIVMLWDGGWP